MEPYEFDENRQIMFARSLRLAMVQQQYNAGRLTLEQALELLRGPLSPGKDNVYDDSDQLVTKSGAGA